MKTMAQTLMSACDHLMAEADRLSKIDHVDHRAAAIQHRRVASECALVADSQPYQARVGRWMLKCFNEKIAGDKVERGDRLLEEVFELLQAEGYDFDRIAQVRDYVAARPVGEPGQELGGVAVCLFAAANAYGLDVGAEAERELARINQPEIMAKIRAKQAAKPSMSPLPQ